MSHYPAVPSNSCSRVVVPGRWRAARVAALGWPPCWIKFNERLLSQLRYRAINRKWPRPDASSNQLAQQGNELFPIERFGKMMVKARRNGLIPIFGSRERRHSNSRNA